MLDRIWSEANEKLRVHRGSAMACDPLEAAVKRILAVVLKEGCGKGGRKSGRAALATRGWAVVQSMLLPMRLPVLNLVLGLTRPLQHH